MIPPILKPVNNTSPSQMARMPVNHEVFAALAVLDSVLRRHYGMDFSFVITGHGSILAASNLKYGVLTPRTV